MCLQPPTKLQNAAMVNLHHRFQITAVEDSYFIEETNSGIRKSILAITLPKPQIHNGEYDCYATYENTSTTFGGTLTSDGPLRVAVLRK